MDLLSHLKSSGIDTVDEISLSNLFENGELVPWPGDDSPGFLSYKHCPNLWTLGARYNSDGLSSIQLIEDIITCANALNKSTKTNESIYMNAYKELVTYLKTLFIYYNGKINIPNADLGNWGWSKYLVQLEQDPNIGKIHIVTLNYDVWLERVLKKNNISFTMSGFEVEGVENKIHIYKPHGSISFKHNSMKEKDFFSISYEQDIMDGTLKEFTVDDQNLSALDSIHAMVPPAGDSNRLDFKWANEIREKVVQVATEMKSTDELVICGISYWHVDRQEIDRMLTNIASNISEVKIINPNSPNVFNAVITTLFSNVKFFKNSKPLAD